MGCKSASISKDRDESAETIREAMIRINAAIAVVDPVNENMNGSNPETTIIKAITSEPTAPQKPCDSDFP